MEYLDFRDLVTNACNKMIKENKHLFILDVQKDLLWMAYMEAFPEGAVRQEFNCVNCKHFITRYGALVSIDGNYNIHSYWKDVHADGIFTKVVDNMLQVLKNAKIRNAFVTEETTMGCKCNQQILPTKEIITWNHFYATPTSNLIMDKSQTPTFRAGVKSSHDVWVRTLSEIDYNSVQTVLDLIADDNLYRGDTYLRQVNVLKTTFDTIESSHLKDLRLDNYAWKSSCTLPESVTHILNSAIGQLLKDITETNDTEGSVRKFEAMVAPYNYKRPKGIITKTQVENAYKTVVNLGYEDSLERRHAKVEDISVEDVIFVNRETRKRMSGGFDSLMSETVNTSKITKDFEKSAIPTTMEEFLKNIVTNASKLELFFDNKLNNNLVTLTAPVNKEAPSMFKWTNGFAWAYNGNISDAIKQRVKEVGGKVDGYMRISLHWYNYDDLDLHMESPYGHVHYANKAGLLDVDMNPSGGSLSAERSDPKKFSRDSVENIIFSGVPKAGTYKVFVNNFSKVENIDLGFEVEVELNGVVHTYVYDKDVPDRANVPVLDFTSDGHNITFTKEHLGSTKASKEIWGVKTQNFVEVSAICLSPNYWGNNKVGAKHYFFMLKDCKNPDAVRGYFNEYLKDELTKNHKRVFEVLASKALTPYNDNQMSGLGFIATSRNSLMVRVDSGKIYKVNI